MIFVYKEGTVSIFEDGELSDWIAKERFPLFVKVSRSNFQELLGTKKFLVMAVVEEDKLGRITEEMESFRNMIQELVERRDYRK